MATSASANFNLTRDDLITEALQLCGAIGDDETPTTAQLTSCSRTLNMVVKAWQADGLQMFRRKEYPITLVATDTQYTFGSGGDVAEVPTRVLGAFLRDTSSVDTPLTAISQSEYHMLTQKSAQSTPTSYYYQHLGPTANLFIWPAPSTGVTDTLIVIGERPIYDFDAAGNDADIPDYYYLALSYGLAWAIGPKYGAEDSTMNRIERMAAFYKADALSYDVEYNTSLNLSPRFY